ncbi:hypothetical protein F4859DRAFT_476359 [Xylaria cf. heliscus]|nr:hypothetical protein F4859DRAFT_476359 [Xylaria cf. heliscus]
MSEQLFTWTSCRDGSDSPSPVLDHETQLVCDAIRDPAICWVCGDVFCHGYEYLSPGQFPWHRACCRYLLCGDITRSGFGESDDCQNHSGENRDVRIDDELDSCTGVARRRRESDITGIPLCVYFFIAYEDDNDIGLPVKAHKRADLVDEVLRWRATTTTTPNQTQLGGDSSMDIPPSPLIPPLDRDGVEATGVSNMDGILPGETIAKLHIRRSKQDPRFVELEGVIPLDSAMQISMDLNHPFHTRACTQPHTPSHPPVPVRRSLPWLRSQNQEKERPASVLDAHFLPCCIKKPTHSRVDIYEVPQGEDGPVITGAQITPVIESPGSLVAVKIGAHFHAHKIPGIDPPQSSYDTHPPQSQSRDLPKLSTNLHDAKGKTPPKTRSPPAFEVRALADTDETSRQLASMLTEEEEEEEDKQINTDTNTDTDTDTDNDTYIVADTTNTNVNNPDMESNKDPIPEAKPEGKGKSVAWDPTVAGGESDAESESSHESYERGLDYYNTPRNTPQGDPRKRRTVAPTSLQRETPAESKEYIESYRPTDSDKRDETTRLASLAMPGRRRGRQIGRGRGVLCSKCGHWEQG